MLGLALLAFAALFLFGRSRFPAGSVVTVRGGRAYDLREIEAETPLGRLFGRSLTVGSAGDDIKVGTSGTVARLSPRRWPLSLFGRRVLIVPTDPTAQPLYIAPNRQATIEGYTLLEEGQTIVTPSPGQPITRKDVKSDT